MITSNRRRVHRTLLCGAVTLGAIAQASPASAESQNEAAARSLFNDGRQLLKAAHYEEACSKFEAARKLFVSTGLLLNLADCHERIHRTASAWTEFGDAAETAAAAGRSKDEAEAKRRQAALEERLSRLTVAVDSPASDEIVKRDGAPIERSAWDTALPVDPGAHVLTAEASGRRSWSESVSVGEGGGTVVARIPPLAPLAAAEPHIPAPLTVGEPDSEARGLRDLDRRPGSGQRAASWIVGGAGAAALVTSGVLGVVAKSQYSSAESETGSARIADSSQAGKLADVATAVAVGGAVAALAGIILWVAAPSDPIAVGLSGGSVFLSGRFE